VNRDCLGCAYCDRSSQGPLPSKKLPKFGISLGFCIYIAPAANAYLSGVVSGYLFGNRAKRCFKRLRAVLLTRLAADKTTMTERLCENCHFFSPAQTCIEKPTWGHCMWPVNHRSRENGRNPHPLFTWADATCSHFAPRREAATRP